GRVGYAPTSRRSPLGGRRRAPGPLRRASKAGCPDRRSSCVTPCWFARILCRAVGCPAKNRLAHLGGTGHQQTRDSPLGWGHFGVRGLAVTTLSNVLAPSWS